MTNKSKEAAKHSEDLARLLVKRLNVGDVEGIVALYDTDAVLATGPSGQIAKGKDAIRAFYAELLANKQTFEPGEQRPAMRSDDLALTSSRLTDGTVTVEVAQKQPDGSWLWIIDHPSLAKEK